MSSNYLRVTMSFRDESLVQHLEPAARRNVLRQLYKTVIEPSQHECIPASEEDRLEYEREKYGMKKVLDPLTGKARYYCSIGSIILGHTEDQVGAMCRGGKPTTIRKRDPTGNSFMFDGFTTVGYGDEQLRQLSALPELDNITFRLGGDEEMGREYGFLVADLCRGTATRLAYHSAFGDRSECSGGKCAQYKHRKRVSDMVGTPHGVTDFGEFLRGIVTCAQTLLDTEVTQSMVDYEYLHGDFGAQDGRSDVDLSHDEDDEELEYINVEVEQEDDEEPSEPPAEDLESKNRRVKEHFLEYEIKTKLRKMMRQLEDQFWKVDIRYTHRQQQHRATAMYARTPQTDLLATVLEKLGCRIDDEERKRLKHRPLEEPRMLSVEVKPRPITRSSAEVLHSTYICNTKMYERYYSHDWTEATERAQKLFDAPALEITDDDVGVMFGNVLRRFFPRQEVQDSE
jgi:hypothetical protein